KNRGRAAARSMALAAASGEYISFLDDDDLFTPHRLELVHGPLSLCLIQMDDSAPLSLPPERSSKGWWAPTIGQPAIRRDLCPMFDDTLQSLEDFEWWIRVTQLASPTIIPRVGYIY